MRVGGDGGTTRKGIAGGALASRGTLTHLGLCSLSVASTALCLCPGLCPLVPQDETNGPMDWVSSPGHCRQARAALRDPEGPHPMAQSQALLTPAHHRTGGPLHCPPSPPFPPDCGCPHLLPVPSHILALHAVSSLSLPQSHLKPLLHLIQKNSRDEPNGKACPVHVREQTCAKLIFVGPV